MPTFIGIDLAWRSDTNHTGGAVLAGDQSGVALRKLSEGLTTLSKVRAFIQLHTQVDSVVAIDAPLIIRNPKGQRPCEKEIGHRFGAAHASAHTSNLELYPDAGSVKLANHLQEQGFQHCPEPHGRFLGGKWFFEVYPHPAHVVLFERSRIIKYKKGRVSSRKRGLHEFRESIRHFLCPSTPPLMDDSQHHSLLERPLDDMKGSALKHYEDILDATFCAYLAAYFWAWSYERNEMIGTREMGYIINPKPIYSTKDRLQPIADRAGSG
jgi:predicted RNase H-like nuclease